MADAFRGVQVTSVPLYNREIIQHGTAMKASQDLRNKILMAMGAVLVVGGVLVCSASIYGERYIGTQAGIDLGLSQAWYIGATAGQGVIAAAAFVAAGVFGKFAYNEQQSVKAESEAKAAVENKVVNARQLVDDLLKEQEKGAGSVFAQTIARLNSVQATAVLNEARYLLDVEGKEGAVDIILACLPRAAPGQQVRRALALLTHEVLVEGYDVADDAQDAFFDQLLNYGQHCLAIVESPEIRNSALGFRIVVEHAKVVLGEGVDSEAAKSVIASLSSAEATAVIDRVLSENVPGFGFEDAHKKIIEVCLPRVNEKSEVVNEAITLFENTELREIYSALHCGNLGGDESSARMHQSFYTLFSQEKQGAISNSFLQENHF